MKFKHILTGFAFFASGVLLAQQNEVLLTIEGDEITSSEFMAIYNKNNVEIESADKKSITEYLDLYVNFKLKVHDAEVKGFDTIPSYKKELSGYVDQLASPYLVDSQFTEALIKEAYDRLNQEVKASHILVKIPENPSPEDTLVAWNKMKMIIGLSKTESDFSKLAKEYSDDPSAKQNGGDLGYFSAFRMVYAFESGAFNTAVGQISAPIRTSYGYHIIKVVDKIPARGEIKAAHIMIVSNEKTTEEDAKKAKKKITEIYQKLQAGEAFAKLADRYSDDRGSAPKGGDLGWFGAGRMVPDFEMIAFAIQEVGQYSEPFLTQYGWHIVLLEDRRHQGTYEEEYEKLSKKVKGDRRSLGSEHALVLKLMKDYKVKVNSKGKIAFYTQLDSTYFEGNWDVSRAESLKSNLITINDKKYGKSKVVITQKDFANYLVDNRRKQKSVSIPLFIDQEFDKFVDHSVIEYEKSVLSFKHPAYKALVTEYHDGILLFEIMEKEVWKKAMNDTIGLEKFYSENKQEYMWNERADAHFYICDTKENAQKVKTLLEENAGDSVIDRMVNIDSELGVAMRSGKYEKGKEPFLENVEWKTGIYQMEENGSFTVIQISELLPSQPKELKEVKGLVTSSYQDQLDKDWVEVLRTKYSFTINQEVLNTLTK